MPLKLNRNTNRPPYKIKDLINRWTEEGATTLLNDSLTTKINDDFIFYLTQKANYTFVTGTQQTDILTAYIYDMFKDRVLLDKYAECFDGWSEISDFDAYVDMVKQTVENVIITNAEKYKKIYYAMTAQFNPLWNVDGTEITERELKQTGTNTRKKTGTDTTETTGEDSTETSGRDTVTNTGTDSTAQTGTDATAHSGSDTDTTQKTTFNEGTFFDTDKVTHGKNSTDTTTHNTTDTTTHNTQTLDVDTRTTETTKTDSSETTYNTQDLDTRNLNDTERIVLTRQGNIGVVSTVKLLEEFKGLGEEIIFIDIVARDIVNSITFMVY